MHGMNLKTEKRRMRRWLLTIVDDFLRDGQLNSPRLIREEIIRTFVEEFMGT